jgi:hypothetical protein
VQSSCSRGASSSSPLCAAFVAAAANPSKKKPFRLALGSSRGGSERTVSACFGRICAMSSARSRLNSGFCHDMVAVECGSPVRLNE